ncbi:MAG TPA: ABC transporter ATP-binding protein [Vicinamibacterales bacterium]|nr:ABC transporter ATP-binding protein [Vicinamibacterales bacterium]HPW19499.1 ABC transporter ATP-binding protein [Vicinamibacterales bacterium]
MSIPEPPAIVTRGLMKRFGRLVAVRALDLQVEPGQVFGFLGQNGAGKTTTIRMLLDLLRPTAGRAEILGHDCQADGLAARALVGYMPGEIGFYRDMTGRRALGVLAELARGAVRADRQRELCERMALDDADLDRPIREYSTGMKRKLAAVAAFQHDPPVLLLDEPTEGLDPLMQEAFYELLADARAGGTTVFLSSHVLSEVDRVCDRIGLLRAGELVLTAPIGEVRRTAPRLVRVTFRRPVAGPPSAWPPSIEIVEVAAARWIVRAYGSIGPVVESLGGLPVADLEVREPRLEDVVMAYYRGQQ